MSANINGINNAANPWPTGVVGAALEEADASKRAARTLDIPNPSEPLAEFFTGDDVPKLPSPRCSELNLQRLAAGMTASFGSTAMAILSETLAQMRFTADEQRIAEQRSAADQMESQADEMRSNAAKAFACALVSAGISLAASIYSTASSTIALKNSAGADPEAAAAILNVKNKQIEGISGIATSAGQFITAGKDYIVSTGEAAIKEMDADIERKRPLVSSLESLSETLSAVIEKAIATQQALQESMNQTRTKILT